MDAPFAIIPTVVILAPLAVLAMLLADCAKYTRMKPWLFSSPAVAHGYVWFGVGLDDFVGGMVPRLFCLKGQFGPPGQTADGGAAR